ncbi:Phosphoribosyl-ATP pyrophosphatase [Roseovarius sp. THAF27]|uniref:phosphoribosyl-ATP diphosphatase n=1 Tax=unclassified Roseovarius TaxID=2614913 RepID=UPI001267E1CD|nr:MULTISPECIES: phosphoribosyl-ATP diphosphatase [unclassified Roseovarius]QFT80267.1 Phosphoribosyl-ATP pyrophosphatase [Roseovarius sp. THAF27]QFT96606.1 Phosphoribosyl-ATP pyrophosphatase [Roseovarius sp. THAF8]
MTLEELEQIVATRASASPEDSWTAKLLAKGPEKVAEKFGEEAIEALIEAVRDDKPRLTSEAADVLFHLLVMLHSRGVSVDDVMTELAARQSQSGLAEKAARSE